MCLKSAGFGLLTAHLFTLFAHAFLSEYIVAIDKMSRSEGMTLERDQGFVEAYRWPSG